MTLAADKEIWKCLGRLTKQGTRPEGETFPLGVALGKALRGENVVSLLRPTPKSPAPPGNNDTPATPEASPPKKKRKRKAKA